MNIMLGSMPLERVCCVILGIFFFCDMCMLGTCMLLRALEHVCAAVSLQV
jgi:hypothetical protein